MNACRRTTAGVRDTRDREKMCGCGCPGSSSRRPRSWSPWPRVARARSHHRWPRPPRRRQRRRRQLHPHRPRVRPHRPQPHPSRPCRPRSCRRRPSAAHPRIGHARTDTRGPLHATLRGVRRRRRDPVALHLRRRRHLAPLSWSGVPDGADELILVVDDPDAAGFVHWVVPSTPPEQASLPAAWERVGRPAPGPQRLRQARLGRSVPAVRGAPLSIRAPRARLAARARAARLGPARSAMRSTGHECSARLSSRRTTGGEAYGAVTGGGDWRRAGGLARPDHDLRTAAGPRADELHPRPLAPDRRRRPVARQDPQAVLETSPAGRSTPPSPRRPRPGSRRVPSRPGTACRR